MGVCLAGGDPEGLDDVVTGPSPTDGDGRCVNWAARGLGCADRASSVHDFGEWDDDSDTDDEVEATNAADDMIKAPE